MLVLVLSASVYGVSPSFHGDSLNQGWQTMAGALTSSTIARKWVAFTGSRIRYQCAVVEDVDGDAEMEVLVGDDGGTLYCYNGITGALEWSVALSGIIRTGTPAAADIDGDGFTEVLMGTTTLLYCLRGADGSTKWSVSAGGEYNSSPTIADIDRDGAWEVLIGNNDMRLHCYSGAGVQEWEYATGNNIYRSTPAVGQANGGGASEAFQGSADQFIHGVDSAGGSLWSYNAGNSTYYSSSALGDIDNDGAVEVVHCSGWPAAGGAHALTAESGVVEWSFSPGGWAMSAPALADVQGDGVMEVAMSSFGPTLYLLNGATGAPLWSVTIAAVNWNHAPFYFADANGDNVTDLVAASQGGAYAAGVWALDGLTGSLLWNYAVAGSPPENVTPADVDGDGCIEVVVVGGDPTGFVEVIDDTGASGCGPVGVSTEEQTDKGARLTVVCGRGSLTARLEGGETLELFDPAGRLVKEAPFTEGAARVTGLRPGVYIARVKAKSGILSAAGSVY